MDTHLLDLKSRLVVELERLRDEVSAIEKKIASVDDVLSMLGGDHQKNEAPAITGRYSGMGATAATLQCVMDGPEDRRWGAGDVQKELVLNGFTTKAGKPYNLILNNLVRHVQSGNLASVEVNGVRRFRKPTTEESAAGNNPQTVIEREGLLVS